MPPLISNYDRSKIFLGGIKTITATYTNGTGSPVTLNPGRIMGRITSSNKAAPHDKDNTDGSQFPRFVLFSQHEAIPDGTDVTVTLAYAGEVDPSKLGFASGESLTSVVSTAFAHSSSGTTTIAFGTIGDLLIANSQLTLGAGTENSIYDNQ